MSRSTDKDASDYVDLGKLKDNNEDQNIPIPCRPNLLSMPAFDGMA